MPRKGSLTRRSREIQTVTTDNRVVLYIRASTLEQVNSLDAQRSAGSRFAVRQELLIDETFIDSGVSAVKCALRDRPQAVRMFRHMKGRGIRTILVLRVDRAFRSSLDFSQTLAWCKEEGFSFRFIDPDIDLGTPMGEMFISIQVSLAQMECGIRSARVDEGLDSLRSRRLSRNGKSAPYGWSVAPCADGTKTRQGGDQYRHLAIPAEQAVLRGMLTWWQESGGAHGTLTAIAARLNRLRLPTKMAGKTMVRHGRPFVCDGIWKPATVQSVLEHAIPATDAELPDGIPTFDQAVAALSSIRSVLSV